MKLIVGTLLIAVAVGYLFGGRLLTLSKHRLRWGTLAVVGLAMQLVNPPGDWPIAMLLGSFVLLTIFAIANRRVAGFWLILIGVTLNFIVIALNGGMPVSVQALTASGQQDTIAGLTDDADSYVKHHLATGDDRVLFLADVIAIAPPVAQVVSLGDIIMYGGMAGVVIVGMRRRDDGTPPFLPFRGVRDADA